MIFDDDSLLLDDDTLPAVADPKAFLGRGLAFPVGVDPADGAIAMAAVRGGHPPGDPPHPGHRVRASA